MGLAQVAAAQAPEALAAVAAAHGLELRRVSVGTPLSEAVAAFARARVAVVLQESVGVHCLWSPPGLVYRGLGVEPLMRYWCGTVLRHHAAWVASAEELAPSVDRALRTEPAAGEGSFCATPVLHPWSHYAGRVAPCINLPGICEEVPDCQR